MTQSVPSLSSDIQLQAYVIGLAIGDGNLSNPNGRAVRLRITCDTKYPALIEKITDSLQCMLPRNKVSHIRSSGNYLNISVYSNHLEPLLGWKAQGGSKHRQRVSIPPWILAKPKSAIPCLRGLIETDGAVYLDRGYPMVIFSTIIPVLARQVFSMMSSLGFRPHLYRIKQQPPRARFKYQVRLSTETERFLSVVRPLKREHCHRLNSVVASASRSFKETSRDELSRTVEQEKAAVLPPLVSDARRGTAVHAPTASSTQPPPQRRPR